VKSWSLASYRRPFLRVDDVRVEPAGVVVLRFKEQAYELETPGDADAAHLAALLAAIRDPASAAWSVLQADGPWRGLVEQLDQYGLLAETDDLVDARRLAEEQELAGLVDAAAEWLSTAAGRMAAAGRLGALRSTADSVLQLADALLFCQIAESDPDLLPPDIRPSDRQPLEMRPPRDQFFATVLDYQLRHWRRSAPHSLAVTCVALRRARGLLPAAPVELADAASALLPRLAGGAYEPADAAVHLTGLTSLLVQAAGSGAKRVLDGLVTARSSVCSGTNLMLEAEALAVRALRRLGPSRYHQALLTGAPPQRLAIGTYVEQYHITRRFVEIILPVLGKRLRAPLRDRLFAYYAEEVGHETFEMDTCLALGLGRDAVTSAVPLPAFTAYIDVFAHVAEVDPIGFLASVMVTEGLPGTRTPVNDLLEAAGALDGTPAAEVMRRHEEVNVELDHTTLARRLLAEVPAITPATQMRALDHMLLLLELNFRAWEELFVYYTDMTLPALHGAFGFPPAS
jgi:hypothetical protein